jgi:putative ABC transport system substrate-binding protein
MGFVKRREFIALAGAVAAGWPLVVRAQQADRVRRVGVLIGTQEGDPEGMTRLAAFEQALAISGWINGSNVHIDVRWLAGDAERIPIETAELVSLQPDAIFAATTPVIAALKKIAGTIPIIFVLVSDPVGSGFVQSLAQPGGNITGFLNFESSLVGKWLGLLTEAAPGVRRVSALFNPQTTNRTYYLDTLRTAAATAGIPTVTAEVHDDNDVDVAIGRLQGDGGLIVMPDGFTSAHRQVIISAAAQYRVPAIYPYGYMATDGGLMAYGAEAIDFYRRAASYVDRILRGEKPADLPVQAPTKFQFIVNLKTAKALGLIVPPTLLATADEVIE